MFGAIFILLNKEESDFGFNDSPGFMLAKSS